MGLFNYLETIFENNFKIINNKNVYSKLPVFIKENYELYIIELYNTEFICMHCTNKLTNKRIISNYEYVSEELNSRVIIIFDGNFKKELRDRNYLISKNINFCYPNNQLFVPEIGIILKEKFSETINKKKFTPADKLIYTYIFLHSKLNEPLDPLLIEKKLKITNTTIKRGIDLLLQKEFIEIKKIGKKNYIVRTLSKEEFFNKSKSFLISSLKFKYFINKNNINLKFSLFSGECALSKQTMLSESHEIFAISVEEDKLIDNKYKYNERYDDMIEINVFNHNPYYLSDIDSIDIISLYSLIVNSNDPRILKELDTLINSFIKSEN